MANWNELFYNKKNREKAPEVEILKFTDLLEEKFNSEDLCIWDLGCGAGRHTVALAKLGYNVYASDNSEKAIELTNKLIEDKCLKGNVKKAEMEEFPWDENVKFNGVISWDVLQHNTIDNIKTAVDLIHDKLLKGGLLLATIKSDKADLYGRGREIEPKTFVLDTGKEVGVPHHYFDEEELRELFNLEKWNIKILAEQIITNVEKKEEFWKYTPFRSTTWGVLVEKK